MDDLKLQVADRLKQATNILVTVKTDPSIDLLAACIGLSLVLDKVGKHATAVFSGEVPSVMDFLKPEETLQDTPNSLRDFIISLDRAKADKLRYKVEDKVVRIFITPFKSGLSQEDLEFSQGDLNIDLLVALGVKEQAELDSAVAAHGRILHDAAIISINTQQSTLGTLNWQGTGVSSVSEMIAALAKVLDPNIFDEQIATALLTGIVAETARFSNDKTSPQTMSLAGDLMAAGANQQLVATELRSETNIAAPPASAKPAEQHSEDTGTLEIKHDELPSPDEAPKEELKIEQPEEVEPKAAEPEALPEPTPEAKPEPPKIESIQTTKRTILPMPDPSQAGDNEVSDVTDNSFTSFGSEDKQGKGSAYLIDKPTTPPLPGPTPPKPLPPVDMPSVTPVPPIGSAATVAPSISPLPEPPAVPPAPIVPPVDEPKGQTLDEIEATVKGSEEKKDSAPVSEPAVRVDDARQQVLDALRQGPQPLEPIAALNAQPLGSPLHSDDASAAPQSVAPAQPAAIQVDDEGNLSTVTELPQHDAAPNAPQAMDMPLPSPVRDPTQPGIPPTTPPSSSMTPPPVPPPMTPPNFMNPAP